MIPTRVGGIPCDLGIPTVRVGFPCDAAPTPPSRTCEDHEACKAPVQGSTPMRPVHMTVTCIQHVGLYDRIILTSPGPLMLEMRVGFLARRASIYEEPTPDAGSFVGSCRQSLSLSTMRAAVQVLQGTVHSTLEHEGREASFTNCSVT